MWVFPTQVPKYLIDQDGQRAMVPDIWVGQSSFSSGPKRGGANIFLSGSKKTEVVGGGILLQEFFHKFHL